jgi:ABC-type ATPase involved in cell division
VIQVSELHFVTEDGIKVLEDVHLHVEQGEFVYIVGPASSGKSLFLGLLGAHVPPQRGQILVHGRNVVRLSPSKKLELRQRIGFLPQGFAPMARTVHENVLFKLRMLGNYREQAEEKAILALEAVGLIRQQGALATELSNLDRMRLGLALAICDAPWLLLIDEPFEGLDTAEAAEVCAAMDRAHTGHLTILAATRGPLPDAACQHRVVTLADGRVSET